MSKLQILVPQYNEEEAVIRPLLDSIEMQCNIDLKHDIEVFIGNDGSDTKLSVDFLKQYSFPIQYHFFEHGRLAATRYKLQQLATADYIMFCDADDKFISTIALSMIFQSIGDDTDVLVCDFLEEHNEVKGKTMYLPHTDDSVFVHGKVIRRQFLVDNEIEWDCSLHEHQDSAFNVIVRTLAKKTRLLKMPIYMWCYNPNSICRKDGKGHGVRTWCAMLDSYDSLVDNFAKRGYGFHSMYYTKWALYATYYEMAHKTWAEEDANEYKMKTYKRLVEFYNKHHLKYLNCPEDQSKDIDEKTKELAERKGPLSNDMPPFNEWLEAILNIFR